MIEIEFVNLKFYFHTKRQKRAHKTTSATSSSGIGEAGSFYFILYSLTFIAFYIYIVLVTLVDQYLYAENVERYFVFPPAQNELLYIFFCQPNLDRYVNVTITLFSVARLMPPCTVTYLNDDEC